MIEITLIYVALFACFGLVWAVYNVLPKGLQRQFWVMPFVFGFLTFAGLVWCVMDFDAHPTPPNYIPALATLGVAFLGVGCSRIHTEEPKQHRKHPHSH